MAPQIDSINAELQYVTGSLIRKYDGVFRGQMTEPDAILLGTTGVAVIECKLAEPNKPLSHLWEGSPESVEKRLNEYLKEIHNLDFWVESSLFLRKGSLLRLISGVANGKPV